MDPPLKMDPAPLIESVEYGIRNTTIQYFAPKPRPRPLGYVQGVNLLNGVLKMLLDYIEKQNCVKFQQ